MSERDQPSWFQDDVEKPSGLPVGFKYQPDLITADEERALVGQIEKLPFKEFEFHGFTGKRRVVSFGWQYDFGGRALRKADDIPPFLLPLRERAARFAGLAPTNLDRKSTRLNS